MNVSVPKSPIRRSTVSRSLQAMVVTLASLGLAVSAAPPAGAVPDGPAADFTRLNLDTGVQGASFTSVGEVFEGEQNIVTSGFGALGAYGMPAGGGTVQVYRPRANLGDWRKVSIADASAGLIFPNRPTIADVNGDGRQDVIVPSGYFFDTNPQLPTGPANRGAITWFENQGLAVDGTPLPFLHHEVISDQPGSYHGVELVDLDGDGIKDLVSTAEQGKVPSNTADDVVELQFFKGAADHTFAAPVTLSDHGGSLPVVHDVNGDGRLDVVTAQYFDTAPIPGPESAANPTFLWLEQVGDASAGLGAANFVPHTIATLAHTPAGGRGVGMGFQIRPVLGFRTPGVVSWIGTNHQNRCAQPYLPHEEVIEFVPGADPRNQWSLTSLSVPAEPSANPTACDPDYKANTTLFPTGDEITSRATQGQGAPGVFGHGDVDGDGDIDLLVSGDGDRRLFWIEQRADGSTVQHTLTDPGEEFGQAGGAVVADLNGDGRNELVFSSFDRNTVALWKRTGGGPFVAPEVPTGPGTPPTAPPVVHTTVHSALTVTKAPPSVRKGRRGTWKLRLRAAAGGPAPRVTVRFKPTRGATTTVRTFALRGSSGTRTGTFTWRPRVAGTLTFRYAGRTLTPRLRDTADMARAKVRITRR